MKTSQLLSGALAVAGLVLAAGCNRAEADREAREAAAEVRTAAAEAGDRLADGWLTTKVQAQYFADREIKARYINVSTRDGVVSLSGYVESPEARQEAVQIARNTDGVRRVENQLVVEEMDADDRSHENNHDLNIKTAVGRKLSGDDDVRRVNVDVDVTDGVVTLSGVVHNEAEAKEAERLAREVDGVKDVRNDLKVEAQSSGDPEKMGKTDDDGDRE